MHISVLHSLWGGKRSASNQEQTKARNAGVRIADMSRGWHLIIAIIYLPLPIESLMFKLELLTLKHVDIFLERHLDKISVFKSVAVINRSFRGWERRSFNKNDCSINK